MANTPLPRLSPLGKELSQSDIQSWANNLIRALETTELERQRTLNRIIQALQDEGIL